jgi:cardiolipin synthase
VLIAVAVTVHTLINKRDVPAAIGWIGMAWLAPVVGALLYVGFGINRVKRRARRLKGSLRNVDPHKASGVAPSDPIERLKIAITKITGQDISTGKLAAVLACGDEAYPRMLAAIEGAKVSIALSTYIFLPRRHPWTTVR